MLPEDEGQLDMAVKYVFFAEEVLLKGGNV